MHVHLCVCVVEKGLSVLYAYVGMLSTALFLIAVLLIKYPLGFLET